MNNSKKLAKNNGVSKKQGGGTSALSFVSSKNKVLVILGILAVIVLCAGVCYMQLRPRAVLVVSTTDENGTHGLYERSRLQHLSGRKPVQSIFFHLSAAVWKDILGNGRC